MIKLFDFKYGTLLVKKIIDLLQDHIIKIQYVQLCYMILQENKVLKISKNGWKKLKLMDMKKWLLLQQVINVNQIKKEKFLFILEKNMLKNINFYFLKHRPKKILEYKMYFTKLLILYQTT